MAILGGSPLGLIGVSSTTTAGGRSTFNDGNTRGVSVALYNQNSAKTYNDANKGNSLFTGARMLRSWPNIKSYSNGLAGSNDIDDNAIRLDKNKANGSYKQRSLHNNNVYDTSVLNIIENLSGTISALRMADFAYLKNLGVFPNNRLMIARRFAYPIGDNLILSNKNGSSGPLATLITWQPADTDFLNISFGEKWIDAKADFKDLLNSLGGDISKSGSTGKIGSLLGSGLNAIPLPGFTEIFQRKLLAKMGIFTDDSFLSIPSGNPNLIKEAKRRATVGYGEAGSGLNCTVSIDMTCEYELKFISGIDPTIVWMDILAMILSFGTSKKDTYGLNPDLGKKVERWMSNPDTLVKDAISGLQQGLRDITQEITQLISDNASQIVGGILDTVKDTAKKVKEGDAATVATSAVNKTLNYVKALGADTIFGLVKKYRVEIMGIIQALSGMPSTPWHITIGNPMRPMFCSGDMLTQDVKITLGPVLAFNDLPSSIKVTFTLTNARSWGLDEIMAKFNSGYIRSVDTAKTMFDVKISSYTVKDENGNEKTEISTQQIGTLGYGSGNSGTASTTSSSSNTTKPTDNSSNNKNTNVANNAQTKAEGGQKKT